MSRYRIGGEHQRPRPQEDQALRNKVLENARLEAILESAGRGFDAEGPQYTPRRTGETRRNEGEHLDGFGSNLSLRKIIARQEQRELREAQRALDEGYGG
jgi:hypothetical protein